MRFLKLLLRLAACCLLTSAMDAAEPPVDLAQDLIGHWPLSLDFRDWSKNGGNAQPQGGLKLDAAGPVDGRGAATFDGHGAFLQVPAAPVRNLGHGDFTVSLWVRTPETGGDVLGDLISQYDAANRRGFHLSLKSQAVTTTQSNDRHLTFSIDDNHETAWEDVGRPGNALLAFGMAVHNGELFAATCEPRAGESGHVYKYAGGQVWTDVGAPDGANTVTALAVFENHLYAATGKYRVAGSSLPESPNTTVGGRVFRYDGPQKWTDCGQLPETEAVGGLIVFRGRLYASSLYRPAGFFRYDGDQTWTDCGTPEGKRTVALGVYRNQLYATSYDGGNVYRFAGERWTDLGQLGDNTQTYSFAVYRGRLFVGTWPSGRVYRLEDAGTWTDVGRLGAELEVMGMLVHNGRLMAGTLPLAEVYTFDGGDRWTLSSRLDHTPDVKYRRAWTMAEYQGRLFCSTLPSGRIHVYEAGRNVQAGSTFPPGWQHVAAVRSGRRLELFVNGKSLAVRDFPEGDQYNLPTEAPLKIGSGENNHFLGRLADVRIYRRALSEQAIKKLSQPELLLGTVE